MVQESSTRISSSHGLLSPELRVVEMDPWKDPRWEAFVLRHPDATIYHHPAWLGALRREYRQTGLFLACEDAYGSLRGVFPLLYTRGLPLNGGQPLTGRRLSSLPRTPLAGPLAMDPAALDALLNEALRHASALRSVRLQIKTQSERFGEGIDGIVRKAWRQTYIVPLSGKPGQPYQIPDSQNRSSIKRAIKKAIAGGVRVRPAETVDELRTWYQMYLETMRRNFVPARPYRFFLALWELMHARGMMRLLLAEQQGPAQSRIIGGHLFLMFGDTVTYAFGGSRTADFSLRPNDIIMGQAIDDASQQGFRFVDLGEVPEGDENLARFKTKWGANPARLYRYYSPDFPDTEQASDEPGFSAAALASRIWCHLPLPMTSWLGDRIYAFL